MANIYFTVTQTIAANDCNKPEEIDLSMATIKDVAQKAGVATSTVSRILSGKGEASKETKERVLQIVQELNYKPNALAKGLKEGKSNTIGLIVPNIRDLVFPAAIRGISDYLEKHGYTLVLVNTDDKIELEKLHINNLQNRAVDGFIISTAKKDSVHLLELKKKGVPIVLLLRHLGDTMDAIIVDNYQGGYNATQYLIEKGHKKIAIVNGTMDLQLYRERYRGYVAALSEAGIEMDNNLVVHNVESWEDSLQAVKNLIERGGCPEAIFATSDPKALGVIRGLKDMNIKVPDDVSVIGFDNMDMAEMMAPPLTTVAQPFYKCGYMAAERLLRLIKSKRTLKPVVEELKTELLIRSSVKERP